FAAVHRVVRLSDLCPYPSSVAYLVPVLARPGADLLVLRARLGRGHLHGLLARHPGGLLGPRPDLGAELLRVLRGEVDLVVGAVDRESQSLVGRRSVDVVDDLHAGLLRHLFPPPVYRIPNMSRITYHVHLLAHARDEATPRREGRRPLFGA